jgi:pyruvate kinase
VVEDPLAKVASALLRLEGRLTALEREMQPALVCVAPSRRASATNLVHYVALRHEELRSLQGELSQLGLSSLAGCESCVLDRVRAVSTRVEEALSARGARAGQPRRRRLEEGRGRALSWESANRLLHEHTHELLGARPPDRHVYIMVTAPPAKEADLAWMVELLRAGMNVLRINCAHETETEWARIVRALKEARVRTGKPCRVLMDLAGPKIRTGPMAGTRRIATWKPERDDVGRVEAPARVLIRRASPVPVAVAGAGEGAETLLVVDAQGFAALRPGDELRFRDARDKKRTLVVQKIGRGAITANGSARTYVLGAAEARLFRAGKHIDHLRLAVGSAGRAAVDVRVGDSLVLTGRSVGGKAPRRRHDGGVEESGVISCTLPAALEHLAVGHRVLFDDGRIHAVVERVTERRRDYRLRITGTQKASVQLHAEKGINLPDTLMSVPSMTKEDRAALRFVARHADGVSLSFVRGPHDVRALHRALDRLGRSSVGVVLKIETRAGFESLPRLLLEGLRRPPLGVMIARGDLAVEVGFERLAELQEEILSLCEAAHVPAIWATQVLDTLARTGIPSRAEVTDAAAGVAAECVMLNKGPFIAKAVRVLADILRRMEGLHYKNRDLFRRLRVSTFTKSTPIERGGARRSARGGRRIQAAASEAMMARR